MGRFSVHSSVRPTIRPSVRLSVLPSVLPSFLRHFHPYLTGYSQNLVQNTLPLFIDPPYSSKLRKKIINGLYIFVSVYPFLQHQISLPCVTGASKQVTFNQ